LSFVIGPYSQRWNRPARTFARDGSIVLSTGIAGERAHKAWALAASGCGAIVSLTRALAVELAPIRVNAVSPGVVRTNLWKNMQDVDPEDMYSHGEKVAPL
jgi:NAD(P)-dependent dehydrogenase (short-subunit alcohol dehydrogenase family)